MEEEYLTPRQVTFKPHMIFIPISNKDQTRPRDDDGL